jgi:hypothetical protein
VEPSGVKPDSFCGKLRARPRPYCSLVRE